MLQKHSISPVCSIARIAQRGSAVGLNFNNEMLFQLDTRRYRACQKPRKGAIELYMLRCLLVIDQSLLLLWLTTSHVTGRGENQFCSRVAVNTGDE